MAHHVDGVDSHILSIGNVHHPMMFLDIFKRKTFFSSLSSLVHETKGQGEMVSKS